MTDRPGQNERDLDAAIQALTTAYAEVLAQIDEMPDLQQAFEHATALAEQVRQMAEQASDLRAQIVRRIWDAEKLSLAALAKRVGVSKARAGQFVQAAKATEAKEGEQNV